MGAITGINKVIIELLKENNTEMEELAKYLKINKETLEKKLECNDLKNARSYNNFTVSQLEKIASFFGYDLCIDFKKEYVVKHCKSRKETRQETVNKMSFLYDKNGNWNV